MRRRISLCAGLALLLVSSGCDLKQVFLADMVFEVVFLPGTWTRFTCIEFGNSPFEVRAGDYNVEGKFIQNEKLPKKFKIRYQIENGAGQTMQRMTHQYKVGGNGSFTGTHRLIDDFVVPVGYQLCMDLFPKRHPFIAGAILKSLDYYLNTARVGAADSSFDPGS